MHTMSKLAAASRRFEEAKWMALAVEILNVVMFDKRKRKI